MQQARKPKRIRILIADREEVFRLGIRKLFSLEDDLRVVAQAASSEQAVSLTQRFKPHVLMVQAEIAAGSPGSFVEQIRRASPRSKVVFTASALTEDLATRYLEVGAASAVLRSAALPQFVRCVREAVAHKTGPVRLMRPAPVKAPEQRPKVALRPADTLTQREKSVIACLTQGLPNREISQRLSIAEQTVKNHLRSIFDKVGVSDRLELVLYAIHQKLELPLIEEGKIQATGTDS